MKVFSGSECVRENGQQFEHLAYCNFGLKDAKQQFSANKKMLQNFVYVEVKKTVCRR